MADERSERMNSEVRRGGEDRIQKTEIQMEHPVSSYGGLGLSKDVPQV